MKKEKHEISLDILILRDREYFIRHPTKNQYIREYIPGEFDYLLPGVPPDVIIFNEDGKELKYILVTTINDDIRSRQPLFSELNEILSEERK